MVGYSIGPVFDVPPEPAVVVFSVLPLILIAAVVIVSVFLLKKFFRRR